MTLQVHCWKNKRRGPGVMVD